MQEVPIDSDNVFQVLPSLHRNGEKSVQVSFQTTIPMDVPPSEGIIIFLNNATLVCIRYLAGTINWEETKE